MYLLIHPEVFFVGSKGGAVVRALVSHQCSLGSSPGVDVKCGSSLLSVLSLVPRGFSPSTPVFSSPKKTKMSKFQLGHLRNQVDEDHVVEVLPLNCYLFIYLFILLMGLLQLVIHVVQNRCAAKQATHWRNWALCFSCECLNVLLALQQKRFCTTWVTSLKVVCYTAVFSVGQ